jgi:hypothetical protein
VTIDSTTLEAEAATELDIPYFQMTKEDWEVEKATIDPWLKSS